MCQPDDPIASSPGRTVFVSILPAFVAATQSTFTESKYYTKATSISQLDSGTVTTTNSFSCEAIVWETPSSTAGGITEYTVRVYYRVNGQQTVGSTTTHNISDPDRHLLAPATLPRQRPLYYQVHKKCLTIGNHNIIQFFILMSG